MGTPQEDSTKFIEFVLGITIFWAAVATGGFVWAVATGRVG